MIIISPMGTGNGAFVIHSKLAGNISGYHLHPYHPNWSLIPPALSLLTDTGKADIIHCTPDHAVFFARQNIPLVISFQNYIVDPFMQPYSTAFQRLYYKTYLKPSHARAISQADTITAVSKFTASLAKRELNIDKEIHIIHNGIDEKQFRPQSQPKKGETIQVLFAGNPTMRKGAQWLESIANKLGSNLDILVTGGLQNKGFSTSDNRIRFIGKIEYNAMPDLYNQVDILLFPSVREGLALSVMEAMACCLPVVATNCSSLPEQIVDGKGGYLCPIGDTDCFAEKINTLANSSSLRKEMGQYNRSKVEEKFTLEKMVKGYSKLFMEVLDSSRKN